MLADGQPGFRGEEYADMWGYCHEIYYCGNEYSEHLHSVYGAHNMALFYNGFGGRSDREYHDTPTNSTFFEINTGWDYTIESPYSDGSYRNVWPCFSPEDIEKATVAYIKMFKYIHPTKTLGDGKTVVGFEKEN
jgi:hypothetical protein